MNKYHIITLAILLSAVSATQALAQDGAYPTRPEPQLRRADLGDVGTSTRMELNRELQQRREAIKGIATSTRQEIRDTRENMRDIASSTRQEFRGIASSTKAEIENIREAAKQRMEQAKKDMEVKREEFKKTVEVKRAEAKKMIEDNRAKLQEKLKGIKDEKKKAAVETVDKRLEQINTERLTHFTNVLEQMDKVLLNIGSRTTKAGTAGKDVAVVTTDIAGAQAALTAARAAITVQTGKTYVLAINQENTLRVDVGKARQTLGADLKAVQDKVIAAREAIRKAATDLAKIPGVDTVDVQAPTATTTATSSNQ